ncbi:MAG: RrF2 family transcriptional regulator [Planctomycetota bacterium]
MRLSKTARYALYAAMEMVGSQGRPVTVSQVAERYRISEGALAKAFQQLVRFGLALGTRGIGGGYRLAKEPAEITVLDVIEVFDPPRRAGHCLLTDGSAGDCSLLPDCRLRRLFDEVDEVARCTLASVSLETLVR